MSIRTSLIDPIMKHGEVWIVNFSPSAGEEMTKVRPAVIVNDDAVNGLSIRVVVPITDAAKIARHWHVKVKPNSTNGLRKDSIVDCFQIKSFSTQRFVKKIGRLSEKDLLEVKIGLAKVLDLF